MYYLGARRRRPGLPAACRLIQRALRQDPGRHPRERGRGCGRWASPPALQDAAFALSGAASPAWPAPSTPRTPASSPRRSAACLFLTAGRGLGRHRPVRHVAARRAFARRHAGVLALQLSQRRGALATGSSSWGSCSSSRSPSCAAAWRLPRPALWTAGVRCGERAARGRGAWPSASRASSPTPTSTSRSRAARSARVIGPNGAGKTTFISMISGHVAPTTGRDPLQGAGHHPSAGACAAPGSASAASSRRPACSTTSRPARTSSSPSCARQHRAGASREVLDRVRLGRRGPHARRAPPARSAAAGSRSRCCSPTRPSSCCWTSRPPA